jgi:translocation and assembly module TamA
MKCGPAWKPALRVCVALGVLVLAQPVRAVVELHGVEGTVAANVLAYLTLDEEPCDAASDRIEQQRAAAPARIRQALEAFGYYEPRIESQLDHPKDCWHVTFTITPGEPVRIRELDVQLTGDASGDSEFAAAQAAADLKPGGALQHGAYEALKKRWSDLARERGYPDAKFVANTIDVYPEQHAADIALRFDSGSRYTFGAIDVQQNVLMEPLVRSYVPFSPGEPYDARKLTELYVALADSGFFRTIDVHPAAPDRDGRTIPVEVALTPGTRLSIGYGIGFSTDTGPRFRFSRNNRRFNENGHQFGMSAQLSPVISEVTANYRLPVGASHSEWLNFDTGVKREDTDTSTSRALELGAHRVHERVADWTRTLSLMLQVEDFVVADEPGRSNLLMPGIDWVRVRADNPLKPRTGSKLQLDLRGATDAVFSDTTFFQVSAEGKWIWSLSRGSPLTGFTMCCFTRS